MFDCSEQNKKSIELELLGPIAGCVLHDVPLRQQHHERKS